MMKLPMLFAAIMALFSPLTFAGASQQSPVVIDFDAMTASGDQWAARSSENDFELIGCGVKAGFIDKSNPGKSWKFGFCQAADSNDEYAVCFTEEPALIEMIAANSPFAFIRFHWDEEENCTRVDFSTQSFYLPNIQEG